MFLSVQALLSALIDYAGLFPPASLDMRSAARNFANYRQSEYAWMLGRFVTPIARLGEFEEASAVYFNDSPWRLSVLGGEDLKSDSELIAGFNRRQEGRAIIDAIEIKAESPESIERAMKIIPSSLDSYFEIPIAGNLIDFVSKIAETGARAKARTGGITADAFPSTTGLAGFIKTCADDDVPFKVTAGLHHPIRSVNNLTYETDSGTAMMHGFINVFLAAAFAYNGAGLDQLGDLLEEKNPGAFRFDSGSVVWRDQMVVRGQLRNLRSLFAISFGSCSFEEPIDDLKKIGLL